MVSALDSGVSSPGSSPGRGHCVVFLGKTLYSHSASLSTQVYKWVPVNLMLGGNPATDNHPIQGGVEILLVTSCYRNQDKLQPDGQQLACMQTLPLPQGGLLELLWGKGSQKLKYFKENMNQNWTIQRDGERGN